MKAIELALLAAIAVRPAYPFKEAIPEAAA